MTTIRIRQWGPFDYTLEERGWWTLWMWGRLKSYRTEIEARVGLDVELMRRQYPHRIIVAH